MDGMSPTFFYTELTKRNYGFVNEAQQEKLRTSRVFVCGVGGMGCAAIQSLTRMGIENFTIADNAVFEVSHLNQQVFATMQNVGTEKVDGAVKAIHSVNAHASIKSYGADWVSRIEDILGEADLVINGMDDIGESVRLYRECRKHKRAVVSAFSAAIPSVHVTRPGDPLPEEWLGYPTLGKMPAEWSAADLRSAALKELEYVWACSSLKEQIDLKTSIDMVTGARARMSFAPLAILTGNLIAYEAFNLLLKRRSGATHKGYVFNPATGKTEHPLAKPLEWMRRKKARREISELTEV